MHNLTLLIPAKFESESLPLVLIELRDFDCKKLIVLDEDDTETINSIKEFDCEILYRNTLIQNEYDNILVKISPFTFKNNIDIINIEEYLKQNIRLKKQLVFYN